MISPDRATHATTGVAICACLCIGTAVAQSAALDSSQSFTRLDANHDGVLSQYEFDGDAAVALMDTDRDGQLSMAEVDALLGAPPNGEVSSKDRLRLADIDNNGVLTDAEIRRGTTSRFRIIDANTDGNVDRDEFASSFGADTP
jgi:hypothetical protein